MKEATLLAVEEDFKGEEKVRETRLTIHKVNLVNSLREAFKVNRECARKVYLARIIRKHAQHAVSAPVKYEPAAGFFTPRGGIKLL